MDTRKPFGKALRWARVKKGLRQESFAVISSRTFISMLERGKTSPTLEKIDSLSSLLNVHPVTLVALTYLLGEGGAVIPLEQLLQKVSSELSEIEEFRIFAEASGLDL